MRASKLLCCCALALCAFPAIAQTRPATGASTPRSGLAALQAPNPLMDEALASRFLFFVLTPEQAAGTPQSLGFRIDLNGQPFLEETLDLRQVPDPQSAAFEILATRPDLRERLYELGGDRSNRVSIQVVVDGVVVRELSSFGELLRYNRGIKRSLRPVAAPSEVRDLTGSEAPAVPLDPLDRLLNKGLQKDPNCLSECDQEYWNCIDTQGCDYGDCSRCRSYYDTCVYYCPTICVEPKSVTNTNKSDVIGVTGGYSECMENWWENDYQWGEWYQWLQVQRRNYTLRRTESCNGTVTYEELNVSYSTSYCLYRTYGMCSYPWAKAWNVC